MAPRVTDLVNIDELIALIAVTHASLKNQFSRLYLKKELRASDDEMARYIDLANRLFVQLQEIGEAEVKRQADEDLNAVTVHLNKYLDPLSFLITVEVARLLLGDRSRREWIMDAIDLTDEDADETYLRLSRLMAKVRSTERQFQPQPGSPDPHFPALESRNNENAQ